MCSAIFAFFGRLFHVGERFKGKCISEYYKHLFARCGSNVYISMGCSFTPETVYVGEHVYFGKNCIIHSRHGKIIIGNHVMFGPGAHIHGGNHIIDKTGVYMDEITKEPESDGEVVIGSDVWVGANAIILSKVHIGNGAVIGAGSVVTKDVEPYSVMVGSPARLVRKRNDGTIV